MKIKSIYYSGKADVYNMEVDETHNFAIENGVITHNCYDEVRYMCMARPIKQRKNMMPKKIWTPQDDPLNMIERPIITTPYDSLGRVFNNIKI
jgi:hypothetical protein